MTAKQIGDFLGFNRIGAFGIHAEYSVPACAIAAPVVSLRGRRDAENPAAGSLSVRNSSGVLTASHRATSSMLYSAQGSIGACIMDAIALVVFIVSVFLVGRIAERRGRSFKIWAWIAAFIGPLALPLVLLFPNLHGRNGDHAQGC
jgi:hypothetical protein